MISFHDGAAAGRFRAAGLWGDRLLVDYVDEQARAAPDKVALVDSAGVLTYRELVERSESLAVGLLGLGVRPGDVVAVQAPNWTELPVAHLALDRLGAVFLPLHDGFREVELGHLLQRARAVAIMVPDRFRGFAHRDLVRRLRPVLPDLRHVIVLRGEPEDREYGFDRLAGTGAHAHRRELADVRPDPDAPLQVLVSSGTTALPKCSVYSDNNTLVRLRHYIERAVHLTATDVAAAIAPAGTGATGYSYPIVAALLQGGTAVLLEHWDGSRPEEALALIAEHRCTYAVVVPTQLVKLVAAAERMRFDPGPLRVVSNAGARLPETVAEAAERLFGCPIQTIYGATDAATPTMTILDDPPAKRRGTAGRVLPGQELRIVGEDGQPLGINQIGEVCWRGAAKSFGYLNDPEGTRAVWDADGWYHSGDLGEVDGEGYLRIVGRQKDMIIRGGRNINPRAIEGALLQHPAVLDVAVVPIPDAVLGERVGAVVVPRPGSEPPRLADLAALVRALGLAAWQQPERLLVMADLPRNAGGKVDKQGLSRLFAGDRSGTPIVPRP